MNFTNNKLSLPKIRDELVRLEDSIIFALIERAQFAQNNNIYDPDHFQQEGFPGSFLEYLLHEIESVHAKVRRYTSPDEYPFTSPLPEPILPPLAYPSLLAPNTVNYNSQLYHIYTTQITPSICRPGDDGNYGSSATKDVEVLQILSRRIHFGKFVAEAKFSGEEHEEYVRLIKKRDRQGLMALLTNKAVEERLLRRLRRKALIYGQEIDDETSPPPPGATEKPVRPSVDEAPSNLRIPLEAFADMYEKYVIPLTKEVEVDYLLQRLDSPDFVPAGLKDVSASSTLTDRFQP
ncbi:putative ARO7-chorismate mutase [Gaertneriomyces semiglobifer]|nr:putative ARO7-chorismate mutase [Gaertneriomyces semiglobifer]